MAVLHDLAGLLRHAVVAQVVEAELRVRAVGDVALVLRPALIRIHRILDATDGEPEVLVKMAHPRRVAEREVVVDRDELHVLPGERVQVERHRRHERLAFARLHLGDLALVKDDAADELHVKGNHIPGERMAADLLGRADQVTARVLQKRERLRQNLVKRLARRDPRLQLGRPLREVFVCQVLRLEFFLQTVDFTHNRPQFLQLTVVARPQ